MHVCCDCLHPVQVPSFNDVGNAHACICFTFLFCSAEAPERLVEAASHPLIRRHAAFLAIARFERAEYTGPFPDLTWSHGTGPDFFGVGFWQWSWHGCLGSGGSTASRAGICERGRGTPSCCHWRFAVEQKLRGLLTSQQPSQMRTVLLRMMLGLPEDDGALPAADVKEKEVMEAAANKEKQKEATIRKENQQIRAHNRDEKKVDLERRLYQERAKQEVLRSDDRVRKLAQEIKRKQEEAQSMPQHDKVPENVVEVEDDEQPKPVENLFCSILALIVFVFT